MKWKNSEIEITWFECNNMKLNTDNCHLLVSGHRYEEMWIKVRQDLQRVNLNKTFLHFAVCTQIETRSCKLFNMHKLHKLIMVRASNE